MTEKKIYKVAELTRAIKATLEGAFGMVWLEGEASNVRRPASGHCYFTLKDSAAQIQAVLFRGQQRHMKFDLKDGLLVRAYGEVTVYERGGNYQLIVRQMEEAGQGSLQAQFEELKKKLSQEGLFDASRKKQLPLLPQHIGVVTSATGAAIQDILNVITRRFPNVHILLAPARVQGEGAAAEVAAAIRQLDEMGSLDVMIVGRGGGSLEDLWCFNEEVVARAIAAARTPVISAVGHEIDFTISDFVADLRAPTPSAAAELVVGCKEDFEALLGDLARRLVRAPRESLLSARNHLLALAGRPVFQEPRRLLERQRQSLAEKNLRMGHALQGQLRDSRQRLDDAGLRLRHGAVLRTQALRQQLESLRPHLGALNPLAVLERGYSVTRDDRGQVLKSVKDVRAGKRVMTRLADGEFESEVTGT